jgi:hypothetical protein
VFALLGQLLDLLGSWAHLQELLQEIKQGAHQARVHVHVSSIGDLLPPEVHIRSVRSLLFLRYSYFPFYFRVSSRSSHSAHFIQRQLIRIQDLKDPVRQISPIPGDFQALRWCIQSQLLLRLLLKFRQRQCRDLLLTQQVDQCARLPSSTVL